MHATEKEGTMATLLFTGTYASDDPTRAALPLLGAKGALEAGHEAEVVLMGEAVYLMKTEVADACNPVGWPNVGEIMRELIEKGVTFYI
jgi:predicted peroxiredoxin